MSPTKSITAASASVPGVATPPRSVTLARNPASGSGLSTPRRKPPEPTTPPHVTFAAPKPKPTSPLPPTPPTTTKTTLTTTKTKLAAAAALVRAAPSSPQPRSVTSRAALSLPSSTASPSSRSSSSYSWHPSLPCVRFFSSTGPITSPTNSLFGSNRPRFRVTQIPPPLLIAYPKENSISILTWLLLWIIKFH